MYGGKIQELAPVREIFNNPLHPYTRGLLGSLPTRRRRKGRATARRFPGSVPDILDLPIGCKFTTRCPDRFEPCPDHRTGPRRASHPGTSSGATFMESPDEAMPPLLEVKDLHVRFPVFGGLLLREAIGEVHAVDGVSFDAVDRGETLGLVGESGCGKTTVGRAIINILRADELQRRDLWTDSLPPRDQASWTWRRSRSTTMRPYRTDIQMIFQDPYSSLEPAHERGTDRRGAPEDPHEAEPGRAAASACCG